MKHIARALTLSALLLAPASALAVNVSFGLGIGVTVGNVCANTICMVAQNIIYIINGILVPVLFAIAFIVFLYGIAKAYIFSVGDPEAVKVGHKLILWGVLGFVVMISLWGIVNVVANTFGLSGAYAPPTPSSVSPYGSVVQPGGLPPSGVPSGGTLPVGTPSGGTSPNCTLTTNYSECIACCGNDLICRNGCPAPGGG